MTESTRVASVSVADEVGESSVSEAMRGEDRVRRPAWEWCGEMPGRRSGELSGSESSVSRLLATLLARPSDSSLWLGGRSCTSCKLSLSSGGPFPLCECEAEGVRLERALNMRDMRVRRAEPEVSLRASSEPRRLFDMREWSASLASERVVDETLGLLERGRSPGVAKDEVRLRRRPMAAMAGEGGGSWVCVAGEPVRVQRGLYGEVE
jgi:hypothetical protein